MLGPAATAPAQLSDYAQQQRKFMRELRLLEADAIVVAEVATLEEIKYRNRDYRLSELNVEQWLKGAAVDGPSKVRWPAPRDQEQALRTWIATGQRYDLAAGERGVFVLRQSQLDNDAYDIDFHYSFYEVESATTIAGRIKRIDSKYHWSEPVDGLQLGVYVEQYRLPQGRRVVDGKIVQVPENRVTQARVHVLVRNVGDEPLHIVQGNFFDKPIQYLVTDPAGQRLAIPTVDRLHERAKERPLTQFNFVQLEPGVGRRIGIVATLPAITEDGEYAVQIRYRNDRDGAELNIPNVWRGQIETPRHTFYAPPLNAA